MSLRKAVVFMAGFSILGVSACAVMARQQSSASQSNTPPPPTQATPPQPLGDVARKVREENKKDAQAAKTFTNDDVAAIKAGGISTVGSQPTPAAQVKPSAPAEPAKGEEYWKKRFAEARQKLALAEKELDVMQRELNLNQMQYYSDPNKALQQQYSRDDINDKTAKIEDKKKEVAQLQQAIADLTEEMRRAGGLPGWAN